MTGYECYRLPDDTPLRYYDGSHQYVGLLMWHYGVDNFKNPYFVTAIKENGLAKRYVWRMNIVSDLTDNTLKYYSVITQGEYVLQRLEML